MGPKMPPRGWSDPPPPPRRWGATVSFDVTVTMDAGVDTVWRELVDWEGHGDWVPMTAVVVQGREPDRFTAWTGRRPLVLEDRMEVVEQSYGDGRGHCEIVKLGPVLVGSATLDVEGDGVSTTVRWREEVLVPWVPQFVAPVLARASAAGFRHALGVLGRQLAARGADGPVA